MHEEARKFTMFIQASIPDAFINKKVLDIGSGDINGNNRFYLQIVNITGMM